jgi:chromosome segregation ATPase
LDPFADDIVRRLQEAQREAELEQVAVGLREQVAQLRDETVVLKSRLEHSEVHAQKLQVENRAMRAQLESAADSGATDTERLAEVQLENSELMGAVMEARAATSHARTLAAAEKATADTFRGERSTVDSQLAATQKQLEEQTATVQQLSEELEALSEAVVDDAGSAEKIEELEMIVEELENQVN